MLRSTAAFCLLLCGAAHASGVTLLDGTKYPRARVQTVKGKQAVLSLGTETTWEVPARALLEDARDEDAPQSSSMNLFLWNGDRVAGTVTGAGERIALKFAGVQGFTVPLDSVRAVHFGRAAPGGTDEVYRAAFKKMRARGRDSVLVLRGERPLPIDARVVEVGELELKVDVAGAVRTLETDRVFGFVRNPDRDPPEPDPDSVSVRLYLLSPDAGVGHMKGRGYLTIPIDEITGTQVRGGGATIERASVARMEFRGPHITYLSEMDPIAEKETALLGPSLKWRRDTMVHGAPMTIANKSFARGIGTHSYSRLEFALGRRWNTFYVECGIDDAAGPTGNAIFRVLGDGEVLATVERKHGEAPKALRINVSRVDRLVLESDPNGSYTSDLCDWAQARLFSAPAFEAPPGGER